MADLGEPLEEIVMRFPPGGPDEITEIRKEAKWNHRAHNRGRSVPEPHYVLSVFSDAPHADEDRLALLRRLVAAAGLSGLQVHDERNSLFWLTTRHDLEEHGFQLRKEGYPGEVPEHYCVDFGPLGTKQRPYTSVR